MVYSGTAAERLDKILNFWKNKQRHWEPPTEFVRTFTAVLRLFNVQNLSRNAETAVSRLFPKGIEYAVYYSKPKRIYTAHCNWRNRHNGFSTKANGKLYFSDISI